MKALARDILGNTLIQNGQIHKGLQHLQLAIKYSKSSRNKSLIHAIETSELIFKNEYGVEIQDSFTKLFSKFNSSAGHDNFSKSNLGLELARQWTLRGEFQKASVVLESVAGAIYGAQNRRQEVRYNLRWAELCFLKNELATALHFIRSGEKSLNYVDQTYEIQLLGLEIKIKEKQGATISATALVVFGSISFLTFRRNNSLSKAACSYETSG